jgi:hypothetical protein
MPPVDNRCPAMLMMSSVRPITNCEPSSSLTSSFSHNVGKHLRGARPGGLPVQFPVKYEMVVNLKTAKSLGLTVPQSILLSADEVIE